jgi:hypothetical protein
MLKKLIAATIAALFLISSAFAADEVKTCVYLKDAAKKQYIMIDCTKKPDGTKADGDTYAYVMPDGTPVCRPSIKVWPITPEGEKQLDASKCISDQPAKKD